MPQMTTVRMVHLVLDSLPINNLDGIDFLQNSLLINTKCQEL